MQEQVAGWPGGTSAIARWMALMELTGSPAEVARRLGCAPSTVARRLGVRHV